MSAPAHDESGQRALPGPCRPDEAGREWAGGVAGPRALRPLLDTVLAALTDGAHAALRDHVHVLAAGAADPADPLCAAHLHCPPLAVAVAADLAASALNPSMDSWDQAPAASALEERLTRVLAAEVHPRGADPDALITTGGTESNLLGVLLAREHLAAAGECGTGGARGGGLTIVCGANAHHSVHRAAWLLGLPAPVVLPTPRGVLDPADVRAALDRLDALRCPPGPASPALVVATAGTTDSGALDPLDALADVVAAHRARRPTALHVDASYGGLLLLSERHRPKLTGLERADSVALDLHKLGWQPVAAGLLTVPDAGLLRPLAHRAEYLNAEDDTDAGLPDLLGRSLRTTRRPDALKIAVTLRALGRAGLRALVDRTCAAAEELADLVDAEPGLRLHSRPTISTVLFRPAHASDEEVAEVRRHLLLDGRAVLGRARAADPRRPGGPPRTWLKATLLNPEVGPADLAALVKLVVDHAPTPHAAPTLSQKDPCHDRA
ncbi:pyridoxal phosphate-dependent decarboxylase family protein [Streptomyces sp. 4N509B]|uniref:pyridoxal phosphate-dependent decarboxylase family protein n=1 Tax=Streptomyces sp. 4N509B TaxID=3457413 RepID=UPI003FD2068F